MLNLIKNLFSLILALIIGVGLSYGVILIFAADFNILQWSDWSKVWFLVFFFLFSINFHDSLIKK